MTLKPREDAPEGYYEYEKEGKKYSVVDFATSMKDHQMPQGLFMGWEAIEIMLDGSLDVDSVNRASSWEELEKILNHVAPNT